MHFTKKGIRTISNLPKGKLRIIASDITSGRILVLPDDLERISIKSKGFEVARAVRMSYNIPYFFEPVLLRLLPKLSKESRFLSSFCILLMADC
ncbi:hypothetical protein D3C74_329630 [compost metagenome]